MTALPHFSPVNDDGLCATVLEQISRLISAFQDAEKANVRCQSSDYEYCWKMVEVEKTELCRLLMNAGFSKDDWEAFVKAFK